MNLHLDDEKIKKLLEEYKMFLGDESYYKNLADYLIEELINQFIPPKQ